MNLLKSLLLVTVAWLGAAVNTAHASNVCTFDCVDAGSVVASSAVDAIIFGNPLTDVLGDPGNPLNTFLGVVLAERRAQQDSEIPVFYTPTTASTLTVQMTEEISGDGMLYVTGDEETPTTLNETFKVFVSATGDFSGTGDSVDLGTYYNNAIIDLSTFVLPTGLNYVKLQAFPNPFGPAPAPMTVLGIAGQSSVIPVPAAVWLFGSGLVGLIAVGRRRK